MPQIIDPDIGDAVALTEIWCRVLQLEHVGLDADLFELGGDSLSAMQILSRVHDRFGVEIALHDFYQTPTIRSVLNVLSA